MTNVAIQRTAIQGMGARALSSAVDDELLEAMYDLELALAAPAPRRASAWCERVAAQLAAVHAALERHVLRAELPRGEFSEIEAADPTLHYRIVRLKRHHAQLLRQLDELETFVERQRGSQRYDFREIRQRTGWLLTGLRHHAALTADLIFELYDVDLGSGD